MSGGLDPITFPQSWDNVRIADKESPGICKVGEWKRAHEWDVKKGKGTLGGTVTFVGRPPAKGSVTFQLWTAAHFVAWDRFRPLLKFDPTRQSVQAVDIYHPSLADIDVTSVVTESIGNIVHAGDGLYTVTVEFLEYFPPPKAAAVGTPAGSRANALGVSPSGDTDSIAVAQQKEIAALLDKASSSSGADEMHLNTRGS